MSQLFIEHILPGSVAVLMVFGMIKIIEVIKSIRRKKRTIDKYRDG